MYRLFLAAAVGLMIQPLVTAAPPPPVAKADQKIPIPAKSLFVVQLTSHEELKKKIEQFVDAALPDLAKGFKSEFEDGIKEMLKGRSLEALEPNQSIYFVISDVDFLEGSPVLAVFLPIKDYKTFREKGLSAEERKSFRRLQGKIDTIDVQDETTYLVDRSDLGYVVILQDREFAELYAENYPRLTREALGEQLAPGFFDADISFLMNFDRLNELYGENIAQFKQLFQFALGQAGPDTGLDEKQIEQIKLFYDVLFQGLEEGRAFTFAINLPPEGIHMRMQYAALPSSSTAKNFSDEKNIEDFDLKALPANMASYGFARQSANLSKFADLLNPEFEVPEDENRATLAMKKYSEQFVTTRAKPHKYALTMAKNSIEVYTPDDPKKLAEAKSELLKLMPKSARYYNVPLKKEPKMLEVKDKVAGFDLQGAEIQVDFESLLDEEDDPELAEVTIATAKLFLQETTRIWFGSNGKEYVQVSAENFETAKKLIEDYQAGKNNLGENPRMLAIRKLFPEKVSSVTYMDVVQMLTQLSKGFRKTLAQVPGLPIGELPELKPIETKPIYAGTSYTVTANGFIFDFFAPTESVSYGRKLFEPWVKFFQELEDEPIEFE